MEDFENMTGQDVEDLEGGGVEEDEVSARLRAIEERQAELDKRERELNKGFMEIAAARREMEARPTFMEDEDEDEEDIPPLNPEAEKILDKFVQKKIGPMLQAQQELYAETVNNELAMVSEKTGVPEEVIIETINETGLSPRDGSIKAAREVLTAAAEIHKARTFDESELEKRIREKVLKELAEQGTQIESVRPTRELPSEPVDFANMTEDEKYKYLKEKQLARS